MQSFKFPVEVHFKINFPQRKGFNVMKQETRSSKGKYKDEQEDALLSDDDSSKRSRTNFVLAQDLADVMDSKDAFMQWLLVRWLFIRYLKNRRKLLRQLTKMLMRN
ncbi:hypothetical protein [Leuconostoc suionicum]|uniref:hypothetical protein n=1 Tax=Leuconostoc suionicum TaxID=1511761 RepID=UPI0032DE4467